MGNLLLIKEAQKCGGE